MSKDYACANELLFEQRRCPLQCRYCALQQAEDHTLDLDIRTRGPVTIHCDGSMDHIRVGDWIRFTDSRPWWRRLWEWLLGRPKPVRLARVVGLRDENSFTIEEVSELWRTIKKLSG